MERMMEGALDLFPLPARIAPFLGRRLQQDALYRTIPDATVPGATVSSAAVSSETCRREARTTAAATAAAVVTRAEGGAQILTYPEARQTQDTR
jgi:hypothetical protein